MKRFRILNITFSVVFTITFILLGVFCFNTSYLRFGESLRDLWQSCKFYFFEIFGIEHITIPTVEQYSKVLEWNIFLPSDFEAFKATASDYFALLFNGENFASYWSKVGEIMGNVSRVFVKRVVCKN